MWALTGVLLGHLRLGAGRPKGRAKWEIVGGVGSHKVKGLGGTHLGMDWLGYSKKDSLNPQFSVNDHSGECCDCCQKLVQSCDVSLYNSTDLMTPIPVPLVVVSQGLPVSANKLG